MLYPRTNEFRQVLDLGGIWDLRFDPEDQGEAAGWDARFPGGRPVAVPASWNDQFADGRDFLGPAWYRTAFTLPDSWRGRPALLRFDSVNYIGQRVGQRHAAWVSTKAGTCPFSGMLPGRLPAARTRSLSGWTAGWEWTVFRRATSRPIRRTPSATSCTRLPRSTSSHSAASRGRCRSALSPAGGSRTSRWRRVSKARTVSSVPGQPAQTPGRPSAFNSRATASRAHRNHAASAAPPRWRSASPAPELWAPGIPALYTLTVEQIDGGAPVDRYALSVGIRTVTVDGDALLLNGKPVYLKGFGRHEDFPVTGRGLVPAVIVKDYSRMEWVGANSFRTTHYPYSEQMMDLADRLGFLVIDETPAVGLFFRGGRAGEQAGALPRLRAGAHPEGQESSQRHCLEPGQRAAFTPARRSASSSGTCTTRQSRWIPRAR